MPMDSKVSFHLTAPVDVGNVITEYPDLGLSLAYDADNKLVRVDHYISYESNLTEDELVAMSQSHLKLFWELMHFRRGLPLQVSKHSVERLQADGSRISPHTNIVSIQSRAAICRSITMPAPRFFTSAASRFPAWLRLANEARDAPPVDAVRNYYMIWEDIHGTPTRTNAPAEALELKFVRDFVSHGESLKNSDLLTFLELKLGRHTRQFDPTDRSHRDLVNLYRTKARTLIESEIERLITETA